MKAILMDVEGTTTSIDFVQQKLFPFAAQALPGFLRAKAQEPQVQGILQQLQQGQGQLSLEEAIALLLRWIEEDKKEPSLKALQGLIWEQGYQQGQLQGHVYPEVPGEWQRWKAQGLRLGIYSSGSVLAQKLIFGHSCWGDLTPYLEFHFDTQVGKKQEMQSYQTIAHKLGLPAQEILFLSDLPNELAAAQSAGMLITELRRDGQPGQADFPLAKDFIAVSRWWGL